jgi:hypothetical protein
MTTSHDSNTGTELAREARVKALRQAAADKRAQAAARAEAGIRALVKDRQDINFRTVAARRASASTSSTAIPNCANVSRLYAISRRQRPNIRQRTQATALWSTRSPRLCGVNGPTTVHASENSNNASRLLTENCYTCAAYSNNKASRPDAFPQASGHGRSRSATRIHSRLRSTCSALYYSGDGTAAPTSGRPRKSSTVA